MIGWQHDPSACEGPHLVLHICGVKVERVESIKICSGRKGKTSRECPAWFGSRWDIRERSKEEGWVLTREEISPAFPR
jgi:hypothetical protein